MINQQLVIFQDLLSNQRKINSIKKLKITDIKRLSFYLEKSIFTDECSIWKGYIIENKNNEYINFFFNKKKVSLQRLLYINFVDDLSDNEYLQYTCENRGKCCSIKHFTKNDNKKNNIIINNKKDKKEKDIIINF